MKKDLGTAYLLTAISFAGISGLQHFYLGKPIKGLIWFFTCGLLFIGTIYDLCTLESQVKEVNEYESIKFGGL